MAFKPLVKKVEPARWKVHNFTPERMGQVGRVVAKSVIDRMYSAKNVADLPAKPLSPAYARQKQIKHRRPVRDMTFTGVTMASIHVVKTTNNQAVIGSDDPRGNRRIWFANARERMFGMSPRDMDEFAKAVRSKPIVEVVRG